MTHDAPRKKQDGTWGYTSANDGRVWPIGYCAPFSEWSDESIASIFGGDHDRYEEYIKPYREAAANGLFHDGGHASAEEACECYKRYLLDFELRWRDDDIAAITQHRCQAPGCDKFTTGGGEIAGSIRDWHLCTDHRTREVVSELLTVGESWHS